jgi:hypothetical protein
MTEWKATFAGALDEKHQGLLKSLDKLQDAAQPAKESRPADLARELESARRDIVEHFRFEEQNGYMAPVLKIQPNLERKVAHLLADHAQLLRSLDDLIAETRTAPALNSALRDKVVDWIHGVLRHEHGENALVQEAFNRDLPAED